MIVRVMGDGQYTINSHIDLAGFDNRIVDRVKAGDNDGFRADLTELITTIKSAGTPVDPTTFVPSDVKVPFADMTLTEAHDLFAGTGIFSG